MFTGIVQTKVKVSFVEQTPSFTRYALSLPTALLADLKIGASVSVNGACQTVVAIKGNDVYFDAIAQTLRCTTIPSYRVGTWVNIERSAKFGDEIGGHMLSGHILGKATISNITTASQGEHILTISCPQEWMKYIFYKGYIAVNGVSLTVQEVDAKGHFSVHLIPETLRITTFDTAQEGEEVNIEIDSQTQAIVDTVQRVLANNTF
ncbi:MAG: riboflavin synthase subunit alpha [Proteobacteria bacterium]|nr:riboflavin synthase subunit alpha [Pseudomonadota bacterium]